MVRSLYITKQVPAASTPTVILQVPYRTSSVGSGQSNPARGHLYLMNSLGGMACPSKNFGVMRSSKTGSLTSRGAAGNQQSITLHISKESIMEPTAEDWDDYAIYLAGLDADERLESHTKEPINDDRE